MRNLLTAVAIGVSALATTALSGCAAETASDAEVTGTDDAELRTLQRQVVGTYASGFGHIELNADGTYVGGYAQGPSEYRETLISGLTERGRFYVSRANTSTTQSETVAVQGVTRTPKLVLIPDGIQGALKVHDLSVLKGGDIRVTRDGVTQIWVRQILRP